MGAFRRGVIALALVVAACFLLLHFTGAVTAGEHPISFIAAMLLIPAALFALWRGGLAGCFILLLLALPELLWVALHFLGVTLPAYTQTAYSSLIFLFILPFALVPRGPMRSYLTRRFILVVPTLIGISLITFLVVQLSPGNPAMLRIYQAQTATGASLPQEVIDRTKELYGLDKPLPMRYLIWLGRMAAVDFGNSYKDHRPVMEKILDALPITLQLNLISFFIIYLFSIPLGIYSATHQYSFSDQAMTAFLFILYSLPNFWVAMLLIYFFGGGEYFNWFPVYGMNAIDADSWPWYQWLGDRLWHIALPVTCLTYAGFAYISRYARAGLIENIRQDYIRTARAYGFSERTVIYKYALRNSLIPIITLLGALLPALISGSVIIEYIFSIPGMGRLLFESILSRDYPLTMGILTVSAFLTLIGLIFSDTLYALVDPRIRFE